MVRSKHRYNYPLETNNPTNLREQRMTTHKIGFVFYKAGIDGKLLDNGISAWTKFLAVVRFDFKSLPYDYAHVEWWDIEKDECISSTMRDGEGGVRAAPAATVFRHPDRWEGIIIEVGNRRYTQMRKAAIGELGKKYDKLGLFTGFFLLAPYLQNDKERYCSDFCMWLAWMGCLIWKRFWVISPRRMAKILAMTFGKPRPLTEILEENI